MHQDIDILAILLFFIGIFFFLRNIKMYFNPGALKKYIETSPKASLWREKFGIEKAIKLSKSTFLPLGILVSIVFIVIGFWNGILPLVN